MKKIIIICIFVLFLTGCYTTNNHYHSTNPLRETTSTIQDIDSLVWSIDRLNTRIEDLD